VFDGPKMSFVWPPDVNAQVLTSEGAADELVKLELLPKVVNDEKINEKIIGTNNVRIAVNRVDAGHQITHPPRRPVYLLRQFSHLLPACNIFRTAYDGLLETTIFLAKTTDFCLQRTNACKNLSNRNVLHGCRLGRDSMMGCPIQGRDIYII
jgi:hypothetical protein